MFADARFFASANLVLQALLTAALVYGSYLAWRKKKKKNYKRHCKIINVVVPAQVPAILGLMLPTMLVFADTKPYGGPFNLEMWLHHSLGVAVVILWGYIYLVSRRIIKARVRLVWHMRTTFILWMVSLLFGVHMYLRIWTNL